MLNIARINAAYTICCPLFLGISLSSWTLSSVLDNAATATGPTTRTFRPSNLLNSVTRKFPKLSRDLRQRITYALRNLQCYLLWLVTSLKWWVRGIGLVAGGWSNRVTDDRNAVKLSLSAKRSTIADRAGIAYFLLRAVSNRAPQRRTVPADTVFCRHVVETSAQTFL